jgi:hypothetical protein
LQLVKMLFEPSHKLGTSINISPAPWWRSHKFEKHAHSGLNLIEAKVESHCFDDIVKREIIWTLFVKKEGITHLVQGLIAFYYHRKNECINFLAILGSNRRYPSKWGLIANQQVLRVLTFEIAWRLFIIHEFPRGG